VSFNTELLILWYKFHKKIRDFFESRGYLEVNTPKMGEYATIDTNIASFVTEDESGKKFYLQTSPEYYHKELLGYGMEQIFEMNSAFRNEPQESIHNPEFLILEWYRVGKDYNFMMDETESLIRELYQKEGKCVPYDFERKSVCELFQEYANIDLSKCLERESLATVYKKLGLKFCDDDNWDTLFFKIFLTKIEPNFKNRAIFVYDYPEKMGAMARTKKDDPRFAERFELYIDGMELCNGYSELTDYNIQRRRFERDIDERKRLEMPVYPINTRFLDALKRGIPDCTGNAMGVERLFAVIHGIESIHEFLL